MSSVAPHSSRVLRSLVHWVLIFEPERHPISTSSKYSLQTDQFLMISVSSNLT